MSRPVEAGAGTREPGKAAGAYRTISEVSDELSVPQHVLRFWETKFTQVRPLKRGGGRRYYRPEDVDLLRRIQKLLYEDGYTIKGVQRLLREGGRSHAAPRHALLSAAAQRAGAPGQPSAEALPAPLRAELQALLSELKQLKAALLNEG
ncbi:MAG: MerR family transcriptional regulator [Inquilinus sp.]|nr:MerR family transcriptional regulator [Inquilinus sp.]